MTWPPRLTTRETEVLRRVAEGATYGQLAQEWGIAEVTVRVYGHRARRALGAATLAHAVLLACQAGLVDGRPRRHGDHAGFAAHEQRGEDPKACPFGCWEVELAYRAGLREARRARQLHAV